MTFAGRLTQSSSDRAVCQDALLAEGDVCVVGAEAGEICGRALRVRKSGRYASRLGRTMLAWLAGSLMGGIRVVE
jgi:hypothetical protein